MATPEQHLAEVQQEIGRDRYLLERMIGAGAMGEVYLAAHAALKRPVVLKFLRASLADAAHDRFRFEAQVVAQLRHEHVVDVIDFGTTEAGRGYLVMEYLEGQPLDQLMKERGPLPVALACELARQISVGLAWCHGKGVIHRDIKPQNLFAVTKSDGSLAIKLLDFGVARLVERVTGAVPVALPVAPPDRRTQIGQILGTPHYMSPEQLTGDRIDGRTDVYATAVVLYRLLTGVLPFPARSLEDLVHAHLTQAPAPPSAKRAEISPDLDAVVLKALAKRADDRFHSNDFAAALAAVTNGQRPPSLAPREPTLGMQPGWSPPPEATVAASPRALAGEERSIEPLSVTRDPAEPGWDSRWMVASAVVGFAGAWLLLLLGGGW